MTERLSEGRNFYDQDPFSGVVNSEAEIWNVARCKPFVFHPTIQGELRTSVTRTLSNLAEERKLDIPAIDISTFIPDPGIFEGSPSVQDEYNRVVIWCFRTLDKGAPDWRDYVLEQRRDEKYDVDGSYKTKSPSSERAKAYIPWVAERQVFTTPRRTR